MKRILSLSAAAFLCCAGVAMAATHSHRDANTGTTTAQTQPAQPATAGDRFASESDAKGHCRGDTVVWVNTKTHVYHLAGDAAFGHTKHGAFMCRADADKTGTFRAAKTGPSAGSSAPPGR